MHKWLPTKAVELLCKEQRSVVINKRESGSNSVHDHCTKTFTKQDGDIESGEGVASSDLHSYKTLLNPAASLASCLRTGRFPP